jgi:hypothetical protein
VCPASSADRLSLSRHGRPARWLPPALVGIAAFVTVAVLPPVRSLQTPNRGDIAHYAGYAERTLDGEVPYRDFALEYPPGALPVLLAPAPANDGFYTRFRVLMIVLAATGIVAMMFILSRTGASAPALYGSAVFVSLYPLVLTADLVVDRYDLWPAVLVLAAMAVLAVGRRRLALGVLGLATAAKFYPLVAVPPVLMYGRRRVDRREARLELLVYLLVGVAVAAPFAFLAPRGLGHTLSVLVRRPLHIESAGGSVLLVAHQLGLYRPTVALSFGGSWDLSGTLPNVVALLQSMLGLAALAFVWGSFARGPRDLRSLGTAVAAAVTAATIFGKVFSPQFMTWLVFSAPLAAGPVWAPALALTEGALILTRLYYDRYDSLLGLGGVSWVLLARNVVLLALLAVLVGHLRGGDRLALRG